MHDDCEFSWFCCGSGIIVLLLLSSLSSEEKTFCLGSTVTVPAFLVGCIKYSKMSRHSHTALSFYLKCSLSLSLSLSLKLAVYKENTISPNKDFPHSKGNQLQSLNSRVLLHFTSCTYIYICLGFQYSVFGFRAPIDSLFFVFFEFVYLCVQSLLWVPWF